MALVGDSRIADILANVVFPFLLSQGKEIWSAFGKLPAELSNRRLETGATRLFGDDPRRSLFLKTRRTPARFTADLRRLLLAGQF